MNLLPILDLPELRDRYGLFEGDGPCVLFYPWLGAASLSAGEGAPVCIRTRFGAKHLSRHGPQGCLR